MIDVQTQHCTTGQFKGQVDPALALAPANLFSVQNMRGGKQVESGRIESV